MKTLGATQYDEARFNKLTCELDLLKAEMLTIGTVSGIQNSLAIIRSGIVEIQIELFNVNKVLKGTFWGRIRWVLLGIRSKTG